MSSPEDESNKDKDKETSNINNDDNKGNGNAAGPTGKGDNGNAAGPTGRGNQQVLEDADENTFRIMLTTDNHLGYSERDPVRGMDSFAAFEEVLYLAKRFKCDLVLISGDLFHENRPSRRTLHKTMEIIRRYCMGPDPVQIQLLSDPLKNFRSNVSGAVNYQDEFYSVDLPIFSIHGNHDDPTREGGRELLAALDLLAVSNLVNYFGRQDEVDKVQISPVLLQKGSTRVAIYGLGSMRDERLNRMWHGNKVRFLRPQENTTSSDDEGDEEEDAFFNIFTLHQNRDLGRGAKNCVQESMIPEWMDLVVWGHEHECLIEFFESVVGTFRITQPGSSVATSLVQGEAARKKVGILDIMGKNFRLHPIPLTQVRPFVTSEVSLIEHRAKLDPDDPRVDSKVTSVLEEEVRLLVLNAREKSQELLEAAKAAGNNAGEDDSPLKYKLDKPNEVLVRLRVEHSGFTTMNNQRFGAKFVGQVANPSDILSFHRRKSPRVTDESQAAKKKRAAALGAPIAPDELERTNMEDLVRKFLEPPEHKLKFLSEPRVTLAMEEFVDKNMTASIPDSTVEQLKMQQKKLIQQANDGKDVTLEFEEHKSDEEDLIDMIEISDKESDAEKNKKAKASPNSKSNKTANKTPDKTPDKTPNKTPKERKKKVAAADSDEEVDRRPGKSKKRAKDDNDEEEESPRSPAAKKKARGRPPASVKGKSTKATKSSTQTTQKKAARRRKLEESDDEEEYEVMEVEPPKRRASPRRSSPRSRRKGQRINYNDGGSDDDEDSDVVIEVDDDDGSDDVLSADEDEPAVRGRNRGGGRRTPTKKPASTRKAAATKSRATTARRTTPPASRTRSTSGRATRKAAPSSGRKRKTSRRDLDESDDSADLDDDWGTAATRSQR